jgi:hypothetical protein
VRSEGEPGRCGDREEGRREVEADILTRVAGCRGDANQSVCEVGEPDAEANARLGRSTWWFGVVNWFTYPVPVATSAMRTSFSIGIVGWRSNGGPKLVKKSCW